MLGLWKRPGLQWVRQNIPRIPLLVNLLWGLFGDPRVAVSLKAALLGVLAYVASPIDFIPDFIPVLGQIDDLALLLAAIELFVRLAPPEVVQDIEQKYREGHGPIRQDLESARRHLGRLWSWALRKVSRFASKYARRVKDEAFVSEVVKRSVSRREPNPP